MGRTEEDAQGGHQCQSHLGSSNERPLPIEQQLVGELGHSMSCESTAIYSPRYPNIRDICYLTLLIVVGVNKYSTYQLQTIALKLVKLSLVSFRQRLLIFLSFSGQTFLLTPSPWVSTFSCFNFNLGWHEKKTRGTRLGKHKNMSEHVYLVWQKNKRAWRNDQSDA